MVNPSSPTSRGVAGRRTRKRPLPFGVFFLFVFLSMVVVGYYSLIVNLFGHHQEVHQDLPLRAVADKPANDAQKTETQRRAVEHPEGNGGGVTGATTITTNNKKSTYKEWKQFAVELAALPPTEVLQVLKSQDPFGVRTFEKALQDMESDRQAILSLEDVRQLFPCPRLERITLPDQRDHIKAKKYRAELNELHPAKENFVFLFFQHLRKAGGTNFCGLAEHNLQKKQVPSYYCMPDMKWSGRKCAGCFLSYSNADIESHMVEDGHRILGNEWDAFDTRFFDLPAVFATSFRRPLDRALSQYRFECIEERGCHIKEIETWWKKRKDLTNVYTWTFSKQPIRKISIGKKPDDIKKRKDAMTIALDTVIRYNLVLVMEWLAYAPIHVTDVLGFVDTSTMTERIRPHINQAHRDDGQEENKLGAAGIAKASWKPENYLSKEQYKIMSEDLAMDEILTDFARRIFLERAVCSDMAESNVRI